MRYIFYVHSFVDLITNSSSELFVATGYKSLEALKELVKEITTIDFDLIFDGRIDIVDKDNHDYWKEYDEADFPIGTILLNVETNELLRMEIIEKYLIEPLGLKGLGDFLQ